MSSPVETRNTEFAILARMNALAERSRECHLTPEETSKLDSYLHVGGLVSILQSKARQFLLRLRAELLREDLL